MSLKHGFSKNKKYYTGTVYEWNLPVGHSCPYAVECLVKVDRETGKFDNKSASYRCYASSAERFPSARNFRWENFDYVKAGNKPIITKDMENVRIHMSGDFFSQEYFDMWCEIANENPDADFWAFTKSVKFWVERLGKIPKNLILTASKGGKFDDLIEKHNLKHTIVVDPNQVTDIITEGEYTWATYNGKKYPVDTNDDWARIADVPFLLFDNNKKLKDK